MADQLDLTAAESRSRVRPMSGLLGLVSRRRLWILLVSHLKCWGARRGLNSQPSVSSHEDAEKIHLSSL